MRAVSLVVFGVLLISGVAHAYETDQLTRRGHPLADARDDANAQVDALLEVAIERTNRRTDCEGDDERIQRVLAREIAHETGRLVFTPPTGRQPPRYFGAYAAWLETGPVDRRTFDQRDDLYSGVTLKESMVLRVFGLASTVRIGDVLLGTDKIDHFWVQGYDYFRKVDRGRPTDEVVSWGTRTEMKVWGQSTTGVFSFADLVANYDGYSFYLGLLEPDSALVRGEDGCVVQQRPFDWSEWVDWRYDEVMNPPVYTQPLRERLDDWLLHNQGNVCAERHRWYDGSVEYRLETALTEDPSYVSPTAPVRTDPFRLDLLCAGADTR